MGLMLVIVALCFLLIKVVASPANCVFDGSIGDDYESIKFDCMFELSSNVKFGVSSNVLMLSNVYQFTEGMRNLLCSTRAACSMELALITGGVAVEALESLQDVDMAPVRAMETFLRQMVTANIKNGFDVVSYTFDTFSWLGAPRFCLVLQLDLRNYRSESQIHYLTDSLAAFIRRGSADIVQWSHVSLYVSFVVCTTQDGEVEGNVNHLMSFAICNYLSSALPSVSVLCHGYAPQEWLSRHQSELSDGPVTLHPLPDNASMEWDTRWSVSRLAYELQQMDYYILLDDRLTFRTSTWILTSLAKVAATNGYFPGLGVGVLQCPVQVVSESTGDAAEEVEAVPLVPVLHRTHFEVFRERAGGSSLLFPGHFTPEMKNMLLVDVYSAVGAAYTYCIPHEDGESKRLMSELRVEELQMTEEYVERVVLLRQLLVETLNAQYYAKAPIAWSRESLAYKQGDLLYEVYSNLVTDDNRSSRSEVESRLTQLVGPAAAPVRIAYITAVFGRYEASLKYFARQTLPSDFICFTDHPESVVNSNGGWIVDAHPYHLEALQYEVEHNLTGEINSLHNNQHPFNIAKYYKMNFRKIPRMAQYDVVVWLDGTIEVHNANTSALLMDLIENRGERVVAFAKDKQNSLYSELAATLINPRYDTQPAEQQYHEYVHKLGYQDTPEYWNEVAPGRANYGLWITCFVAFDMRRAEVRDFLRLWSDHNRRYSTQDQLSFPFVVQATRVFPFTLPPAVSASSEDHFHSLIKGYPYINTLFYKHKHGL